jgi:hypothetical protein
MLLCSLYLPLGVPNWAVIYINTAPQSPFRLYIPLDGKNLKTQSIFLETYCKPPPSSMRDQEGPEALPGTLPERGIPTGGLLHHHDRLRSDV